MLLQNTFKDLKDDWPQIPNDTQCIQLWPEPHAELHRQKFFELIRQEVKLEYSDRILILAPSIASLCKMWEDTSKRNLLTKLHNLLKLDIGEKRLVQRFNLDTVFLYGNESAENSKLLTDIHEEVHNIRKKIAETLSALKRFNPY